MSSERHDRRGMFGRSARPIAAEQQPHSLESGTSKQVSAGRVQHLANHLASLGKLNIYLLAAEWELPPADVVDWLTELHHEGLFERIDHTPYFRVILSGPNGGGE